MFGETRARCATKENCPSREKAEAAVLGCGRCFLVSGKGELIEVEEIMKTEG